VDVNRADSTHPVGSIPTAIQLNPLERCRCCVVVCDVVVAVHADVIHEEVAHEIDTRRMSQEEAVEVLGNSL